MNVCVGSWWNIEVHDVREMADVEPARCDIGCDEQRPP
jgi:hypothetical protein